MDIKPKFNDGTIKFSMPIRAEKLSTTTTEDPKGDISAGLYKIIRWEKIRQIVVLSVIGTMLLCSSIMIALFAAVYNSSWAAYIIPSGVAGFCLFKVFNTFTEMAYLKKAVVKYREDIRAGLATTPPFLEKIYSKLHIKQIRHNWAVVFVLFNGTIITLLLWWLKDVHWWIFDFKAWVKDLFSDPTLMTWIFTFSLVGILVAHLIMTIQRKRRILEIEAYYGTTLVSAADMEKIKEIKNRTYRRLFIWYVVVILVLPLIVWMIVKLLRRRK